MPGATGPAGIWGRVAGGPQGRLKGAGGRFGETERLNPAGPAPPAPPGAESGAADSFLLGFGVTHSGMGCRCSAAPVSLPIPGDPCSPPPKGLSVDRVSMAAPGL